MTAAMALTAPAAGALSDRIGPRPLLGGALAIEALALLWLSVHARGDAPYATLAPALAAAGIGAATLFAPLQAAQLGAVAPEHHGQASGAAITVRELGGVLGVAVIGAVFAAHGTTATPSAFLTGARPALLVAALTVAAALTGALALPPHRPSRHANPPAAAAEPAIT